MSDGIVGFGFNPAETENHFYVIVPSDKKEDVCVYERFKWDPDSEQIIRKKDILKLRITRHKWSKISVAVMREFNTRLKSEKLPTSRFRVGGTPLDKFFGKELMILLWGIEKNDPAGIPTALRNWMGLRPEERWWLYTMTNASTGKINDTNGWRTALRYILCDNPVDDSGQLHLDDFTADQ